MVMVKVVTTNFRTHLVLNPSRTQAPDKSLRPGVSHTM
jgi:hypothetical protein